MTLLLIQRSAGTWAWNYQPKRPEQFGVAYARTFKSIFQVAIQSAAARLSLSVLQLWAEQFWHATASSEEQDSN